MERSASTLVLGVILLAATSWVIGSITRFLLVALGRNARYAGQVGGLAAFVAFGLLLLYGVYRLAFGRR